MNRKPKTLVGRILPFVGVFFVLLGMAQTFYLAQLGSHYGMAELVLIGVLGGLGAFVTGVLLLTLGMMLQNLQYQGDQLESIAAATLAQTELLRQQIRQHADSLDVQRRQVGWLEKIAPPDAVVAEMVVPSFVAEDERPFLTS
ncbi:MAG: hypothetical protein OEY23_14475 [Acidimicrobiia bacterium]|nr:hypothetical protein [Acidimicrobiia bacterium]